MDLKQCKHAMTKGTRPAGDQMTMPLALETYHFYVDMTEQALPEPPEPFKRQARTS